MSHTISVLSQLCTHGTYQRRDLQTLDHTDQFSCPTTSASCHSSVHTARINVTTFKHLTTLTSSHQRLVRALYTAQPTSSLTHIHADSKLTHIITAPAE